MGPASGPSAARARAPRSALGVVALEVEQVLLPPESSAVADELFVLPGDAVAAFDTPCALA